MECIIRATEHERDLYFGSWWIYFRIFESGLVFYFRPQNFHSVQYSIHTTLIHQILNMFTQSFKSHFHNIVSRHCVCDTLCHVNCILFSIVEKINIQYFSKLKKLMGLCFCVTVNQEDHGFHITTEEYSTLRDNFPRGRQYDSAISSAHAAVQLWRVLCVQGEITP